MEEYHERLEELAPIEEEYYDLLEQVEAANALIYAVDEGFICVEEIDGEYYLFPVGHEELWDAEELSV